MKTKICILLLLASPPSFSQDSSIIKATRWLTDHQFSIRKAFDGSRNENRPAGLLFSEDHRSSNDFFNIDIGVKLSQLELLKHTGSGLIVYPKIEWHKSTDSTSLKNKIDGGINMEFFPFGLKSPGLPEDLPNKGARVAPWFLGTTSFRRNLVNKVYETRLALLLSFASNYKGLPGAVLRDKNDHFRMRYYPYFGIEYNRLPDLVSAGKTEVFSSCFVRLFAEIWVIPGSLQLNVDAAYRQIIHNRSAIRTWLPFFSPSLYFYPGQQEAVGIGYEYSHGYDNLAGFQFIQNSSLTLNIKI